MGDRLLSLSGSVCVCVPASAKWTVAPLPTVRKIRITVHLLGKAVCKKINSMKMNTENWILHAPPPHPNGLTRDRQIVQKGIIPEKAKKNSFGSVQCCFRVSMLPYSIWRLLLQNSSYEYCLHVWHVCVKGNPFKKGDSPWHSFFNNFDYSEKNDNDQ